MEANLRETELQHVRTGQSALVTVSLYGSKQTFHGTVEGLVPGSGSAFALLPPDNSTGNFIHIVERVPVRIALPAEEIREHPIRPGLSTVTSINVTESGQSVWTSLATPSTAEYETDVYADELPTAESMAKEVMASNLVVADDEVAGAAFLEEPDRNRIAPREGDRAFSPAGRSALERARLRRTWDNQPSSFVPRRSPDMGVAAFPLTPSIGPSSGALGPDAGRGASRMRPGSSVEAEKPSLGTGRH
ncbi:MAG: HlyD family secretion protein [Nitrospira sp.]|nr:HlyD family secretion protein [Nitrospira sp.]